MGVFPAMALVIYKNKTNLSLAPNFKKQNEVENSSSPSPFHLFIFAAGCGMRLFPLAPLSSLPFQACHSACLGLRTLGTWTETEAHPGMAGHFVLCCPSNLPGPQRSSHVTGKKDPSCTFCGWPPSPPSPTPSLSYIKKKIFPPLNNREEQMVDK